MADEPRLRCTPCGFESAVSSGQWQSADHPPLGTVTRCPECGSTNVHTRE